MKRLLSFLLIINYFDLSASQLAGGEITWACQGSGQYIFTLKLYRDCSGLPMNCSDATQIDVSGLPGLCSIYLNASCSQTDLSPTGCLSCLSGSPQAREAFIWNSLPVTLNGVPPATGWTFSWNSCCRNSLQNLNAGSSGLTIRSKMYPYNGMNANPCFDSSPQFLATPQYLFNTGYTQTANHGAFDFEHDSLSYEFRMPLNQATSTCPQFSAPSIGFTGSFSAYDQLPDTSFINSKSGILTFQNDTFLGNFTTCILVTAYKSTQKVAEVFREYPVTFINTAPSNTPPDIIPPFTTGFDTTICALDTLRFRLRATDFEMNPPSLPQAITITSNVNQYGVNYSNASQGCNLPPCATLNKILPSSAAITNYVDFTWAPGLNHYLNSSTNVAGFYCFNFEFADNYCPAKAFQSISVCVNVAYCNVGIKENNICSANIYYANQQLYVDLKNSLSGKLNLILRDLLGNEIMSTVITNKKQSIPVQLFTTGIYLASIQSENGSTTKKIVVY